MAWPKQSCARMSEFNATSRAEPKRIMVVDDDLAVREMLVRGLTDAGYLAFPAAGRRQAFRILGAIDFDLVLLDVGIPKEDSWATLTRLRRQLPGLLIVAVTARPHQHAAARSAGATSCFEKPLEFPELLRAIAQLFAAPGSLRSDSAADARRAAAGPIVSNEPRSN